jgi:hypothetical protein
MTQEALKLALNAMNAMLTHMGMDEHEFNKVTYDQMRQAIAVVKKALAQPEQKPVAWPCRIDIADFSENTIMLVMQCEDYKVSAGTHWLSTTPPQRTWVGLTRAERFEIEKAMSKYYDYQHECKTVCLPEFAAAIEAKLKEKNT